MPHSLIHALIIYLCMAASAMAGSRDLTIYCEYAPPGKAIVENKGGLIYDQVWELMRRTDIAMPVHTVTWKRGYAEATSKPNIGLFPTTRTAEREPLFHWIGPILRVTWAFYALKDSGIVINSLEDAKKVRSIGTYANDGKEQWLKGQGFTNLESVMDNLTNMKKLYNGRIDLMVGSPSVTDQWPDTFGFDPAKLVKLYEFKNVDLYLAVSKGTSMDTVRALEKAFKAMAEDGTVRRLYTKWAPNRTPPVGQ